jgi:hypothetical protein
LSEGQTPLFSVPYFCFYDFQTHLAEQLNRVTQKYIQGTGKEEEVERS